MAPKATSYTQLGFEKEQTKEEDSMSIEELVEKYMKEQENLATMTFQGQHESSPSTLGVNIEEENLRYNEEITSKNNEELEKFQTVENDAQSLETLVVKEDEPTSPESHEKTNYEVVKTIPKMTLWVPMHEEVKNENKTPTFEVDEYIIHLNNELRGITVNKKNEKNRKYKKYNNIGRLCAQILIKHNYCLLEKDGGQNYQHIRSW